MKSLTGRYVIARTPVRRRVPPCVVYAPTRNIEIGHVNGFEEDTDPANLMDLPAARFCAGMPWAVTVSAAELANSTPHQEERIHSVSG